MKTDDRSQIERSLSSPAGHLFFLLYGPDESGSRALVKRLSAALGPDSERVDLSGAELKEDPARLAVEAASISLFGGRRFIEVAAVGDEILPALEALLEAPGAANPVAIVAGALKSSSKLLKLAHAEKRALAFASYPLRGGDAERAVVEIGRRTGLSIRQDVASRLAEAAGGNRSIMELELAKLALYVDASPEHPRPLDHDSIDAVGAGAGDGDLARLVDGVGGGKADLVEEELTRLSGEGVEGISLVRAMLRRMLLLARLRAQVDRGASANDVINGRSKSFFWMEKTSIAEQLSKWRSELIAQCVDRLAEAELQIKAPGGVGPAAADEELFAICRQASRLR